MSDDLVRRVARAIALAYDYGGDERWLEMAFHSNVSKKRYPAQARAAIAVVLEEAARVAERCDDGTAKEGPLTAHHIAAAIRAMVKEDK